MHCPVEQGMYAAEQQENEQTKCNMGSAGQGVDAAVQLYNYAISNNSI